MYQDQLSKAVKDLMFKEPFYGILLLGLNKESSESIPTACVSIRGIDFQLTINPKFFTEQLDEKSRVGVVKHELLHICFNHLLMSGRMPDRELANIAMDLEVNQYIDVNFKTDKWKKLKPIELENFPELNLAPKAGSIKYYDELSKILQKRQQNQQGQGGQGQDQQEGNSQGQQDPKDQQGQGDGQGQHPGKGQPKRDPKDPTQSKIWDYYQDKNSIIHMDHKLWKEMIDGLSEAEKKLINTQIENAIKKASEDVQRSRGLIPGELKDIIDELFKIIEPAVDWKAYLRRFAGHSNKIYTKKTRHKPNRRFPDNPALKIKQKKHILVARDTSGSVLDNDHKEFWSELHHMYKTGVKITILDADAGCHNIFEYKGKPPVEISGRGGTNFDPAIEYYNQHFRDFDNLIYLTDGECSPPNIKPRTTMLWIISSRGNMEYAKGFPGLVVQIKHSLE